MDEMSVQTPKFPHKNAFYTSIKAFFCEKIWWFEKFVVILQPFFASARNTRVRERKKSLLLTININNLLQW